MIRERSLLALELASLTKNTDLVAVRAFANSTTTLQGSSKGYSVAVRNLEGVIVDSFDLPDQEIVHGDIFVLRGDASNVTSNPNPFGGTTYTYGWDYLGEHPCSIELLLNDQVVGSKLVLR